MDALLLAVECITLMGEKIINDGVEALAREPHAHFQIIESLPRQSL